MTKIAIVQHDIPSSNFLNNMDRLNPLLNQQPGHFCSLQLSVAVYDSPCTHQ